MKGNQHTIESRKIAITLPRWAWNHIENEWRDADMDISLDAFMTEATYSWFDCWKAEPLEDDDE